MARKKIVFVIVEGPSDEDALGIFLSQLFAPNHVYVQVMNHDITAGKGNQTNGVIPRVAKIVKEYAKTNKFTNKDFDRIIHISDTDGAYISPDLVIEDQTLHGKSQYTTNCIRTKNESSLEGRNIHKSANFDRLSSTNTIWGIPYAIYYMSSNLDHVLHNKTNLLSRQKRNLAFDFAKRYKNDLTGFAEFICHSSFSVVNDYDESWDYIRKGTNSLKRYSNLGILFYGKCK